MICMGALQVIVCKVAAVNCTEATSSDLYGSSGSDLYGSSGSALCGSSGSDLYGRSGSDFYGSSHHRAPPLAADSAAHSSQQQLRQ